jgi:hypothetical protein
MKQKQIQVSLNDDEIKQLKQIAEEKHMSLSALVRENLQSLLKTEDEQNLLALAPGLYNEDNPIKQKGTREIYTKTYWNEEEYDFLKKCQNASSAPNLSSYIRSTLLTVGNNKYIFEIKDDDLQELNEEIAEINMHITGFIAAMRYKTDIYEQDIVYIKEQLNVLNEKVETLYREINRNRYSIRQQGRRYLEKQINGLIEETIKDKK